MVATKNSGLYAIVIVCAKTTVPENGVRAIFLTVRESGSDLLDQKNGSDPIFAIFHRTIVRFDADGGKAHSKSSLSPSFNDEIHLLHFARKSLFFNQKYIDRLQSLQI